MSHCPAVHRTAVALIRRATWARPAHSSALSRRSTKIPASRAPRSKASHPPGKRRKSRRKRLKKSCTHYQSPARTKIWRTLLSSCQSQRWRDTTTRLRKKYGKKQTNKRKPWVFLWPAAQFWKWFSIFDTYKLVRYQPRLISSQHHDVGVNNNSITIVLCLTARCGKSI